MTVFKSYLKILRKNSLGILAYIIIFTAITLVSAVQASKNETFYAEKYIKISVINQDDKIGEDLKEYLVNKFKGVNLIDNEKNITEALVTGYVDYVVRIKNDKTIEYYTYKDRGESFIVNQKIFEYIKIHDLMKEYSISPNKAKINTENILNDNPKVKIISKKGYKNTLNDGLYYYFSYLLYPIMAILIFGVFFGTSPFRKSFVKNRIDVSSVSSKNINKKLMASSISFVVGIWLYFILLAILVFGFKNIFSKDGINFLISSLVYLVPSFSIAFFVSTVFKSSEVVGGVTTIITLFLSFVSGLFVPMSFLPSYVEKIAMFSPMYWSIKVIESIKDGNFYSFDTIVYLGIEILMGLSIFLVTFILQRNKAMKTVN